MSDLEPTPFIESRHPAVVEFARQAIEGSDGTDKSDKEKAIRLFLAVRDEIRYDPYVWSVQPDVYKASTTLKTRRSYCVPKAILLAACARSIGIPARLGFADVRNHLATRKLLELMQTDLFVYHGYTDLYLDRRWVKATPSFNLALCQKFGVRPLDFDGETDAVFHPLDTTGRRHMEYVRDHGSFSDLPLEQIIEASKAAYPAVFAAGAPAGRDFEREILDDRRASGAEPVEQPA